MAKVIIIGGGAAGMMAAYSAALTSKQVILLEKNEKLGKKIFITGKGRCNLTNASDMNTVMENVVSNKRFLFSAFKNFTNEDIMRLVEENGTKLKIERGNRVFPVSDHSSDIIKSLENALRALKVDIRLNTKVDSLLIENDICKGVIIGKNKIMADAVIVATGGMSYQATGSDGDGYRFAKEAGLSVRELQDIFGFATPQAIYKWQHGAALPTIDNLIVLSTIFKVSMEEIIIVETKISA